MEWAASSAYEKDGVKADADRYDAGEGPTRPARRSGAFVYIDVPIPFNGRRFFLFFFSFHTIIPFISKVQM